jgi:SOS-response transcriptional repressor LexA
MNKNEARKYLENIISTYNTTQTEIANKVGVNRQYINSVYKGKIDLSLKTLGKLKLQYPLVDSESQSPVISVPYNNSVIYIDTTVLPNGISYSSLQFIDVSGNSMYPEYNDSDRILINTYDNKFTDGNVYVFTIDDITYIRLINITPKQIKCIALNEEFDTFYLDRDDEVNILGAVIPRIRL